MIFSDVLQSVTAIGVLYAIWKSERDHREAKASRKVLADKVDVIHKTTNGLSERNEAIAMKLGVAKGTAVGLEQGRNEHK